MQEPKTGRRIVSKGEYAWLQSKTAGIYASSLVLWGAAMICGALTLGTAIALAVLIIASIFSHGPLGDLVANGGVGLFAGALFAGATYVLGKWACKGLEYDGVKNAVPLTRANTADLPAPDSLVRASQEPAQAQKGVLLRAVAGEAQKKYKDQLLRTVTDVQEGR